MKPDPAKPRESNGTQPEPLKVQVYRIEGDLIELLFYPREIDLRVGETLTLVERETQRSVIAQVIAFRSASYPSLAQDQMLNLLGPEPLAAPLLETIGYHLVAHDGGNGRSIELGNIKVALAKIRKTVSADSSLWEQWDGWIPARDADIFRTHDEEVFVNATRNLGHPLNLGWTLGGASFQVEGNLPEKWRDISFVKLYVIR